MTSIESMADDHDPAFSTLSETNGNCSVKQLEKENFMKPEKVKSRWRRNSEMETEEPSTVIPEMSSESTLKDIPDNKDSSVDEEILPPFEILEENLYLFERKKTKRKKEVRRMQCECVVKPDEPACGDECLNRLLMIECGSRCITGEACSNRRFEKRLYAKTQPFRTAKKGFGLRVLEDVPKGHFIVEYVGEVLNRAEFKRRVKQYAREKEEHYYFMALKIDEIIDAKCKANVSRFINHSCNPNCETQKWTVNGELRIGFFAKRDIKANEELTFDYKLERYGRQAQKCYCQAENCKGFIGVSDEITVALDSKKENKNKRKKSAEKEKDDKKKDILELEDLMLEEEIEKLSVNAGLRNKDDTLMLARLMVRAEDSHSREKLLDIILGTTEMACLRLFLDYHGLTSFWIWMVEDTLTDFTLKKKILKALSLLPVPNKTMLSDSKVLSVVEKWATCSSIADEETKLKSCDTSDSETERTFSEGENLNNSEKDRTHFSSAVNITKVINSLEKTGENSADIEESSCDNKTSDTNLRSDEESGDNNLEEKVETLDDKKYVLHTSEIANLAQSLLDSWKDLKEVFRIPRREKKNEEEELCKNVSESHTAPNRKSEIKNVNIKQSTGGNSEEKSYLTDEKEEKIKVVVKTYEKNEMFKSMKQELGMTIRTSNTNLRLIPNSKPRERRIMQNNFTVLYDGSSDYLHNDNYNYSSEYVGENNFHHCRPKPLRHNEKQGDNNFPHCSPQPLQHNESQGDNNFRHCRPELFQRNESHGDNNFYHYRPPLLQHNDSQMFKKTTCPRLPRPGVLPNMGSCVRLPRPGAIPNINNCARLPRPGALPNMDNCALLPTPGALPNMDNCTLLPTPGTLPNMAVPPNIVCAPPPQIPVTAAPPVLPNVMFPPPTTQFLNIRPLAIPPVAPEHSVTIGPNPQINNMLPAPHLVGIPAVASPVLSLPLKASSSEPVGYVRNETTFHSEKSATSMETSVPVTHKTEQTYPSAKANGEAPKPRSIKLPPNWKTAKDPEGNVYFYHVHTRKAQWGPPDMEENMDVDSTPTYDEPKEHKHESHTRRSHKKKHSKRKNPATTAPADTSSREMMVNGEIAKKIRELFRTKMSTFVVSCLNPYRKDDCKVGRITSNEDFKHLARKLTHFVMAKELKHCKNIEDLDANESVKLKAKDYIRKYMDRYGPVYKKEKTISMGTV